MSNNFQDPCTVFQNHQECFILPISAHETFWDIFKHFWRTRVLKSLENPHICCLHTNQFYDTFMTFFKNPKAEKQSDLKILLLFAECRFGDQTFELEQTWHPDLGAPFGIMYCVHCECVPVSLNIF